jgi:hypothetical protein
MLQVRELRGPAGPGGTEDVRGADLPDVVPAPRLLHRPHRPHHKFQGMRGGRQYVNCSLWAGLCCRVAYLGVRIGIGTFYLRCWIQIRIPNTDPDPGVTIAL